MITNERKIWLNSVMYISQVLNLPNAYLKFFTKIPSYYYKSHCFQIYGWRDAFYVTLILRMNTLD